MSPEQQDLLSRRALGVFRLNGQFLAVAEEPARPADLTAARWQVLGAVLTEPLPASGIARATGITRQSVQRIADLPVERGLAEYRPAPAHRRAELLAPTERAAPRPAAPTPATRPSPGGRPGRHGEEDLARAVAALERLSKVLEDLGPPVTEP